MRLEGQEKLGCLLAALLTAARPCLHYYRHFQGQPLSAMPTPFDQNLLIQPQQHHQLMSAQMQQQAQAHAQAAFAPLSIVVNKVCRSCSAVGVAIILIAAISVVGALQ